MSKEILTTQEKIDIIYDMLHHQERRRKVHMTFILVIRMGIAALCLYLFIHPELIEQARTKILNEYIYPEVSRIASDIIDRQQTSLKERQNNIIENLRDTLGQ